MINIKSNTELQKMRVAGKITAQALQLAGEKIKSGMSTYELDKIIHDFIISQNAIPSFLNYNGFKGSACISINDEVIHGIPSKKRFIQDGDIVSVDVGAYIGGYHGDSAKTFAVGEVSDEAKMLMKSTEESLYKAIEIAKPGVRIGDISSAIQEYNEKNGYFVVTKFVGHGIGRDLHEDPEVPNFGKEGHGVRLVAGMVIAIEPMINIGTKDVYIQPDGWVVKTKDSSLSAHFEHTIAITQDGAVILTKC